MSDLQSLGEDASSNQTSRRRFLTRTAAAGTAAVAVWSIPTVESHASTGTSGSPFEQEGHALSYVALLYQVTDDENLYVIKFEREQQACDVGALPGIGACDTNGTFAGALPGTCELWQGAATFPEAKVVVTLPAGVTLLGAIGKCGQDCTTYDLSTAQASAGVYQFGACPA